MTIKDVNVNKIKNELIELIERDTPKKVITQKTHYFIYDVCPNCKVELNEYYKNKYCKECGQRLDWSGVENE